MIYFIWRVKGSYASYEARRARQRIRMGDISSDVDLHKNDRQDFEVIVLTPDPMARDVAQLALSIRIGKNFRGDDYEPQITGMEYMGEGSTANEE